MVAGEVCCGFFHELVFHLQLPRVPSLIPSSFATRAIGRDVSITIFTASSLNSGEKLFFGRDNYLTFPDIHPIGWTVRKLRGTPQLNTRELRNSGLHEALTWDFGLFWRWRGLLVRVWVSSPSLFQEPLVLSYLPDITVAVSQKETIRMLRGAG